MENETLELELVQDIFAEMSKDLDVMLERRLSFRGIRSQRIAKRVMGEGQVHISFRFAFGFGDACRVGCFLLPLQDATAMAAYLLALGEAATSTARGIDTPDATMKESMLLLGEILAGSVGRAVKRRMPPGLQVRFDGCQGVRADVRPAFAVEADEPLILGQASAQLGSFEPFCSILMLPLLNQVAA